MSKIALSGNASGTGTLTLSAPNTNSDRTIDLPDAAGTVFVSGQAVTATTGNFSGNVTLGSSVLETPTGSAPSFMCRAFVNFNGEGTVAIRASGNVSSITDNGIGGYTINFATAMPDANYCVAGTAGNNNTNGNRGTNGIMTNNANPPTSGNCPILSAYGASASTDGSLHDVTHCYVAIFR